MLYDPSYYEEVGRTNYFKRHYLVKKTMVFKTPMVGFQATVLRGDGKILSRLEKDGTLEVYPDYYWDGPSGPTVDTHAFIIASVAHDIFYQMLRENLLINPYMYWGYFEEMYREFVILRDIADKYMKQVNREYGMTVFRAYYTWWFVHALGEKNALPEILKNASI